MEKSLKEQPLFEIFYNIMNTFVTFIYLFT